MSEFYSIKEILVSMFQDELESNNEKEKLDVVEVAIQLFSPTEIIRINNYATTRL